MSKNNQPSYSLIKGVYFINSIGRYRAKISGKSIGTFDKKSEAINARIVIEDIFKNILTKLDIDKFYFYREREISVEVITNTGEYISIKTGILYSNSRNKSKGGES